MIADKIAFQLRAITSAFVFALLTIALMPFQWLYLLYYKICGIEPVKQIPIGRLWHRGMMWSLGIHVAVKNREYLSKSQNIILCNHISNLDIPILAAVFGYFFVAKSDIADWPIFGYFAKLTGTIFISRQRMQVKKQMDVLKGHINKGKSLILFPEATTSNGQEVLPFKSSMLNLFVNDNNPSSLTLQPVTLAYTHMNGRKLQTQEEFDAIAWYVDMPKDPSLGSHLWNIFGQKGFTVEIVIHPPIQPNHVSDAKVLAAELHATIAKDFYAILSRS